MDLKQMSALCIAQPWAHCVIYEGKNVENSSLSLKKRGTVAIYASRSNVPRRFEEASRRYKLKFDYDLMPKGMIIGFATISDVIKPKGRGVSRKFLKWWDREKYGYVISDVIPLKNPVFAKPPNGAIKFWYVKGKLLQDYLKQLTKTQLRSLERWE